MKNFKAIAIVSTAIAILAVIGLVYVVAFKDLITETSNTDEPIINEQPDQTDSDADEPENPGVPRTYTDTVNKFSFQYPGILKAGKEDFTYMPDGSNRQVKVENSFNHEINAEYCAASGECRPTTQDFGFNIAIIPSPLSDVQKSMGSSAEPLTAKQFGSVRALTTSMGVEGEGRNYYFIALPNNKTLMLEQAYIDENMLINYKDEPDFIEFAQQNKMMSDIITSIKFLK